MEIPSITRDGWSLRYKVKYYFLVITLPYIMEHEKYYTRYLVGATPSLSMQEYLQIKLTAGASVCIVII